MVHLLNVAGCAAAACACWPEPVSSWCCDLWPRLVKTPFTWGWWGWGGVSEYALLCSVQYAGPSVKVKLLAEYNIHQGSQKHHNNNNKFSIDNTSSRSNNTNSAVSQVKCDADAVYFFFLILFWPHTTKSGSRRSGSRASFSWSCVKAAAAAAVAAQLAVAESVSAAPSQSQSASRR